MRSKPTCKPYPHQVDGVKFIERHNNRLLIADDMGLGKTISSLGALHRNTDGFPAVVICPANVKYNWELEALHHFGFRASVCESERAPDVSELNGVPELTVINYDILSPKRRMDRTGRVKSWLQYLKQLKPKTVIIDECHMLGSMNSQRTKDVTELCRAVPYILPMSGTPIVNCPYELFPILRILWPEEFNSFWNYAERYCNPTLTPWGWQYKGATNTDELHDRITRLGMLRRKKSILDLPKKTTRIELITMRDPDQYALAKQDFMAWVKKHKGDKARSIKKAESVLQVGYMLRLAAQLKMRACAVWANKWLVEHPGEKLVMFGVHTAVVNYMKKEVDCKSIKISGQVSGRRRQESVWQFQNDKDVRFCIAQIKAGGVGINLTAASTVAFVEFWHNPATHMQAGDRVYRIGQHRDVDEIYLVARGSVEEALCKKLQRRQESVSAVIDGTKVSEDFNLYHELVAEISGSIK